MALGTGELVQDCILSVLLAEPKPNLVAVRIVLLDFNGSSDRRRAGTFLTHFRMPVIAMQASILAGIQYQSRINMPDARCLEVSRCRFTLDGLPKPKLP